MRAERPVARLLVGMVAFVGAAVAPIMAAGAQPAVPWTLSLTVTKTVEGDGLVAFVAAHPVFAFLLEKDIYAVTATCAASAVMPEGPSAPADATGIHLAGSGSEGSATVTLGAGKQATIPITVEDPTEVDVVSCTITEEPIVLPAVFPGVRCETSYRPSHAAVFTANGQSTTLNVVNTCVPSALAVPPQPLEITPEFTG